MKIRLSKLFPSLRDHAMAKCRFEEASTLGVQSTNRWNRLPRRLRLLAMTRTTRFTILGSFFLLIGVAALTIYLQTNHAAEAAWYNTNWNYREPFTITNSSGGTLTNIQKAIQINTATLITAGKLQTGCQDLKFTDNNGNPLTYYIDSGCNTSTTNIWIIIPNLVSGVSTLEMYYGNPSATQGSTTNGFDNVIGLQGYWTMNEGTGININDSSPHGNNGTVASSPSWQSSTQCTVGQCLFFNGSGTTIGNVADNSSLDGTTGTWEVWVKEPTASTGNGYSIMAKTAASGSFSGITIFETGGNVSAVVKNGSTGQTIGSVPIADNKWHLITLTFVTNSSYAFYVDGVLNASGSLLSFTFNTSFPLRFGTSVDSYWQSYNGYLDDARIYSTVRSASQVLSDYQNPAKYTIASAASVPSYSFGSEEVGPGPSAYWKFDEGTGTTANDSTSNGINGTFNATWQSGKQCQVEQNCLSFDGSSNYVTLASAPTSGTGSFSAFTWVKTSTTGVRQAILQWGNDAGTSNDGAHFYINASNNVQFDLSNVAGTSSTIVVTDGKWHHIGVVNNAGTIQIYVDGHASGSSIGLSPNLGTTYACMGARCSAPTTWQFKGMLNDPQIFNYALTTTQITQDYSGQSVTPAPVSYWKLTEGTGTSLADSSGSDTGTLHGTVFAGPTWQTADQCISSKCLYFNGSNNNISMGKSLQITGALTYETWIKTTQSGSGSPGILGRRNGDSFVNIGSDLELTPGGGMVFAICNGSTDEVVISSPINDGKWHHIVAVYQPSTAMTIYVDGVKNVQSTSGIYASLNSASLPFDIGSGTGSTRYFNGFIDEPKIYPYARTAAQVKADYNSRGTVNAGANVLGASSQSNINALNNGLVGYWKMDEASWNGTSGEVKDSSGNGNNGTATNAIISAGKFGNGGKFDGSGDYINVPYNSIYDPTNAISYGGWFQTSDKTLDTRILSTTQSGGYNLALNDTISNAVTGVIMTGGVYHYVSYDTANIANNTWYFGMVTYDGRNVKLYINGALVSTTPASGAITYTVNNNLCLGGEPGATTCTTSNDLPGLLDELRIYNRALSSADVQNLYNYAPGPVAYYTFNEGTGSTVNDTSGYGNTGIWNGTLGKQWVNGKVGKAGSFNGTNNNVSVANNLNLSTSLSVSAWIFATSASGSIGAFDGKPSTAGTVRFFTQDGWQTLEANSPGDGNVNVTLPTNFVNHWHYLTKTVQNGVINTYVDGVLQKSVTYTTTPVLGSSAIGSVNGANWFKGSIDDVRIYNYAITQKQIIQDMDVGASTTSVGGSQSGAVGYWKFDEGYGTKANNAGNGGSSLNGTINNMASPATATSGWQANGKFGKALAFDASNDYIGIANPVALQFAYNQSFTVSAWANVTAFTNAFGTILGQGSNANNFSYSLIAQSSDNKMYFNICKTNVGCNSAVSNNAIVVGGWHHYVGVYNGSTLLLYVDGVLQNTTGTYSLGAISNPDLGFYMGSDVTLGSTRFFNGKIDDVKIYPYALSASDVQQDYNHNSGLSMGSLGTAPDGKTASNSASAIYCVPGDTATCTPPVAEYNFEEATGSTVNDSSGNGNTGTWNGTLGAQWKQSKDGLGWAGNFNGTDNYISTSSPVSTQIKGVSIEGWFYWDGNSSGANRILFYNGNSASNGWGILLSNGSCGAGNQIDVVWGGALCNASGSSYVMPTKQWTNIAATISSDGTCITLYVNGNQTSIVCNGAYGGTNAISGNTYMGWSTASSFFGGKIDQVRYYNYARTPSQVAWEYNHGGPSDWWKMDECQGTAINDASGNGNAGTLTIGASGSQTAAGTCNDGNSADAWNNGTNGKFNSSMNFDGTDDYVGLPNLGVGIAGRRTISGWIYPTAASGFKTIFASGVSSTDAEGTFYYNVNNKDLYWTFNNDDWDTTNNVVPLNTWSFITFVYYGGSTSTSTVKIYVNGVSQNLTKAGSFSNPSTSNSNYGIGYDPINAGRNFSGRIDDLRVYNYPLTPLQIKLLYNDGAAVRFAPLTGTP